MSAAALWFLIAADRSSNRSNKKPKQLPRPNVTHYARAWRSLKCKSTDDLMRVSGLRHEQDRDILQLVRGPND
jgi:hypothetical protein